MESLSLEQAEALLHDWSIWGRPEQQIPPGDWLTWLIMSGRGWGKTRVGAEATSIMVESGRAGRIALVAETAADARDVMVEGPSGILACARPWFRPVYESSKRRLTWPNGAVAHTYNATEPDQLRGPQHDWAWSDELAKWKYAQDTWDNLQFGLRIGLLPRQMVTTTPRPIPLIRELLSDPTVHVTRGTTMDNAANLARSFMTKIQRRYAGTRLGRQELRGEVLDDAPGTLWPRSVIDRALGSVPQHLPQFDRVVVAVDPSGASDDEDDGSDDIGIVVAALGSDQRAYVLEDATLHASPAGWGRRVVDMYHRHSADRVVGEQNFGGDMVAYVIRTVDPGVPYLAVTASRGKVLRAEPVAALYEQGRVSHMGSMPELEDEMVNMTRTGYMGRGSPNRVDALVWALTELMVTEDHSLAVWERMAAG